MSSQRSVLRTLFMLLCHFLETLPPPITLLGLQALQILAPSLLLGHRQPPSQREARGLHVEKSRPPCATGWVAHGVPRWDCLGGKTAAC